VPGVLVTLAGVGLVAAVAAFIVDGLLWSFVFNKGMGDFTTMEREEARRQIGALMGKQFANTLLFGLGFTGLYVMIRAGLPMPGMAGALLFAVLLWIPTTAHTALANNIWYGKVRTLSAATAWTALARNLVAAITAVLLL
jgi:hypothetical protein